MFNNFERKSLLVTDN